MPQFEELVGVNFWTALFVLLNTLLVFFVAKKYLTGPIMKIIAQRQQEIADTYGEAEAAKTDAEAMQAEYRQRLSAAKSEAAQQAGQLMDEAQREAAALKRRAEQDIEAERRKAAMELKGDISELALTLAGKVVEKELDPSTQQSLIDGFLDDLGDLS